MLEKVEVTQGSNGYPKGIYTALISDSYEELSNEIDRNGGDLVLLRKRDGWDLWEKRSNWYGNLIDNMNQSDGDTVHEYTGEETPFEFAEKMLYGNVGEYLKDTLRDEIDLSEAFILLSDMKDRVIDFQSNLTMGERCMIWMTNPNPTDVSFIIKEDDTSWYEDVWTYQLAVVNFNTNIHD
jgi:hypothetical protein